MNERDVIKLIETLGKTLPKFSDGRVDYTRSDVAPVVVVFVKYKDKILLLKRSARVLTYKNKWQTVAGYWDEPTPARKKILEELLEEIGVHEDDIVSMKIGDVHEETDAAIGKTWIVTPALVELKKKPVIKLSWEHIEYKWIIQEEITRYDIVPGADRSLKAVLNKI